jgi:hypothetical protein
MEVLARLLLEDPPAIDKLVADIPPRLAHLIGALLAKDPSHRLGDAAAARVELAAIRVALATCDSAELARRPASIPAPIANNSVEASTTNARPPGRASSTRTRRWQFVIAAPAAVVVVVGVIVIATRSTADPDAPPSIPPISPIVAPCTDLVRQGCEERCAGGEGEACYWRGQVLYRRDHVAGLAAYARACELGFAHGCEVSGALVLNGVATGEQPAGDGIARAEQLLSTGCDRGSFQACLRLAREHIPPKGRFATDLARAYAILTRACTADERPACIELRRMIDGGLGDDSVRRQADVVVRAACERNVLPCP